MAFPALGKLETGVGEAGQEADPQQGEGREDRKDGQKLPGEREDAWAQGPPPLRADGTLEPEGPRQLVRAKRSSSRMWRGACLPPGGDRHPLPALETVLQGKPLRPRARRGLPGSGVNAVD